MHLTSTEEVSLTRVLDRFIYAKLLLYGWTVQSIDSDSVWVRDLTTGTFGAYHSCLVLTEH